MSEKTKTYVYAGKRLNSKHKLSFCYVNPEDEDDTLLFKKTSHHRIGELAEVTEDSDGLFTIKGTNELIEDKDKRHKWLMTEVDEERKRSFRIAKEKAIKEDKHLGDMTVKELLEFADKSMANSILVRTWINSKTSGWKSGWKL